ncbi:MAG: DM13 domain-containing protein [Chlorobia bacterium]|nr:DM13 domain-containing protein [Fimbriimonadaceae bacterium]
MRPRNTKKIIAFTAIPILIAGWALFRPELALVNNSVDEAAPSGKTSEVIGKGEFASYAHETTGTAQLLMAGDKKILRLSGFKTSNGPDVHVLLVKGSDSKMFDANAALDLGVIKGNVGDQNYELPAGTNLADYQSVSIWCKRFNVSFGGATLAKEMTKTSWRSTHDGLHLVAFGEIVVTFGKFRADAPGVKGKAQLVEDKGLRFIRLSGASAGMSKGVEVYLVKKETFSKGTDLNTLTKIKLGTFQPGAKQEFAVSKDLDLWLYRSVALWDPAAKKVVGAANLRSAQEAKPPINLLFA